MDAIARYFDAVSDVLAKVRQTQTDAMERAAACIAEAVKGGRCVFAFGCSHAGLLALELYYRTGGLAVINPVRAPGLCLDIDPATMTSQMERLPEYGRIIVDNQPMREGDVFLIHSVSGRNTITVDAALRAAEKGVHVIALTNVDYSRATNSRHPSGKRLCDVAELVIDNCGCIGDSAIDIEGVPEKVAPTSTAVGAAIVNAVMARSVEMLAQSGFTPPIFVSANLDHGDAHNKAMLAEYGDRIFYMGHAR